MAALLFLLSLLCASTLQQVVIELEHTTVDKAVTKLHSMLAKSNLENWRQE